MVQHNTGNFFIIFANILITVISLAFTYVALILAAFSGKVGTNELLIITVSLLTIMLSWLIIFLYLKKQMHRFLLFFFIAGIICIVLAFFGKGLSIVIPGAFYLIGSGLVFKAKPKTIDEAKKIQLHNNWKLTLILIGNILNTFIWVFFCYIFILLIGNRDIISKLMNTNFNESFTIFFIVSTLIFTTLNWAIYYSLKAYDNPKQYFYFLVVGIINIIISIYNIIILNHGKFPAENELLGFLFEAPVFLFLFPGLLFIVGFLIRNKPINYTETKL